MVGLVLVSHSRSLAHALQEMLGTLYGGRARVAIAAGAGEDQQDLGTDATAIMAAIVELDSARRRGGVAGPRQRHPEAPRPPWTCWTKICARAWHFARRRWWKARSPRRR